MNDLEPRRSGIVEALQERDLVRSFKQDLVLTQDQKEGLVQIKAFLQSSNAAFSLSGPAGTGKTTLLKEVIKGLRSVSIAAPTHRAKEIASSMTGVLNCFTLAELLGMNPDVDVANFDPHNMTFAQKREPKMGKYQVNIIDECSMVNVDLDNLIRLTAEEQGVQVIYVGDKCQLPPVGSLENSTSFDCIQGYSLTQIVRQEATNPLTYLLYTIRYMQELYINDRNDTKARFDEVWDILVLFGLVLDYDHMYANRRNLFFYLILKDDIREGKGFAIVKNEDEFYKKALVGLKNDGRILAFTNAKVQESNKRIRELLGYTKQFEYGELVTGYKTLRDERNNMFLTNSKDYRVVSKEPKISANGIQVLRVGLQDVGTMGQTFVDVIHPTEYDKFIDLYYKAQAEAVQKRSWPKFFQFKDAHALTGWNNQAKQPGNDLEYGYSITIHKSQGGTYKYGYIHLNDILKYIKPDDNASVLFGLKLLYVAASRATDATIFKY